MKKEAETLPFVFDFTWCPGTQPRVPHTTCTGNTWGAYITYLVRFFVVYLLVCLEVVMVHVEPVPNKPPKEVPGSSRSLVLKETDVVHITRQQLHFVDQQSADRELTFTVTTPPFYSRPHRWVASASQTCCGEMFGLNFCCLCVVVLLSSNPDAGRLFLVDSIPKFTKDANAPMLRVFTQVNLYFLVR